MMTALIDALREDLDIQLICRELAIAKSSCNERTVRIADRDKRHDRARRDDEMRSQINRTHEASFGLYGAQVMAPVAAGRRGGWSTSPTSASR
jgi:hypothetical protein